MAAFLEAPHERVISLSTKLKGRQKAVLITSGLFCAALMVGAAIDLWFVLLTHDLRTVILPEVQLFLLLGFAAQAFILLAFATTTIILVVWFYRARSILWKLGRYRLPITPGWSAALWFVPFVNFLMPFLFMRETWQASSDKVDWSRESTPWKLSVWWVMYLAGVGMFYVFVFDRTLVDATISEFRRIKFETLPAYFAMLLSTALAMWLVHSIGRRIERCELAFKAREAFG